MKFEELTSESQDAARQVLLNVLVVEFKRNFSLKGDEINELSHKIRTAFLALECKEPMIVLNIGRCGQAITQRPIDGGGHLEG